MIQGDVSIFLSALGARQGEPRLDQALSFVGGEPEIETFDDSEVEATYLTFADAGVEFLLKDGAVNTIFVFATTTDDQSAYSRSETLVQGVSFSDTPADLISTLGPPKRSTATYVLYTVEPGYVQFDFAGDALRLVAIMRHDIGE